MIRCVILATALLVSCTCLAFPVYAQSPTYPPVSELKSQPGLPDPLLMLDGSRVATKEQWETRRKPELRSLFQHYMYGQLPPRPEKIEFIVEHTKTDFLDGKATKKEVTIRYSPEGTPDIHLLVVVPNERKTPAPVFVGMNFGGNHMAHADPSIRLPLTWVPDRMPGVVNNKATDEGRGKQTDVWNIELIVSRGYALATLYCGDLDPDKPDFTDGLHPFLLPPGKKEFGPHDSGSIAVWAWGIHRAVDYCVQDKDLDAQKIAVVGHSRLGKTALVAGAFDERIGIVIPSQAGCGGTAPSRGKVGESVKQINDRFPHWFCDEFTKFNEHPDLLPFDQNCLIALCAPRPVLLPNAIEDQWANPDGQFEVLLGAEPVYKLLGVEGCAVRQRPAPGELVDSRLGYFYRNGKHSMSREDWEAFLKYADKQWGK
jgi:hypothetical protein